MMHKKLLFLFLFALLAQLANAQFYYGIRQSYGKNRVQYNNFEWKFFRYDQYDVYFYKNGREVAEEVSRMVHRNLDPMEKFMGVQIDDRIRILVFNSLTDLKQSNLNEETEDAYNTGGITRLAGGKMFVYFDGSYAHLEQQIKQGLADVLLNELIYGGFTNSVKNSALLSLPEWFLEGLISYVSGSWTPELDAHVKDGFYTGQYHRLNGLVNEEARYAGHSIWNYIAETYGTGVIKNLLYIAVANRNLKEAFLFVLGVDFDDFMDEWEAYYRTRYNETINLEEVPGERLARMKKFERITEMKVTQDGNRAAYSVNRQGRYKVFVHDLERDKRDKVFSKGYRIAQNTDYSFPLLAWHPNGEILAIVTEEKGFLWLYFYDAAKKKLDKKNLFGFEKVLSFTYSPEGKTLLMSAVKEGKSDIYTYTILSRTITPLTNDGWDDLEPAYFNGGKQVVWKSNRPQDTLRWEEEVHSYPQSFDLFAVRVEPELKFEKKKFIWRLTESPGEVEYQPFEYEPGFIGYLSRFEGTQTPQIIGIDSVIAFVDTTTHYQYVFDQYVTPSQKLDDLVFRSSPEGDVSIKVIYRKGRYQLYKEEFVPAREMVSGPSGEGQGERDPSRTTVITGGENVMAQRSDFRKEFEVDIEDYQFDPTLVEKYAPNSQRRKPPPKQEEKERPMVSKSNQPDVQVEEPTFDIPPSRNYYLSFFRDKLGAQIDFIFENPQYQPYTGSPNGALFNPGFNVNFTLGATDLMNDYRIIGGFRWDFQPLPGMSIAPNSEFFLAFLDHKKRLNKDLFLYRRSQLGVDRVSQFEQYNVRFLTHEIRYGFTWPFNEVTAIRLTPGIRFERMITPSDFIQGSLQRPDIYRQYAQIKFEYIFDNTRRVGINLYHGLRYKVFTEYYKNFSKGNTGLHTAGIDLRHYLPVHREIIWANRFAFGTSFGPEKLLYVMGGVDNQINQTQFLNSTPVADQNYIFQTLVTNMRGFVQNIRNGNSFVAVNSELRVPFFRYLFNRPLRNDFFSNFQIVGFGDVGTAWNGLTPYSEENAITRDVIRNGPIEITLKNRKDPFVYGYGFGLRSTIFGYFVRVDWAWGIEDGVTLPRVFYLSLSTDF